MLTVGNERWKLVLYSRKENSPYLWDDKPSVTFKGRPANQMEKKNYRIQQGVNGGSDSVFVVCSNLPKEVNVNDKVVFMGKQWTVMSIGYYFDQARVVNPAIMSDEYLIKRCPKGINLQ